MENNLYTTSQVVYINNAIFIIYFLIFFRDCIFKCFALKMQFFLWYIDTFLNIFIIFINFFIGFSFILFQTNFYMIHSF